MSPATVDEANPACLYRYRLPGNSGRIVCLGSCRIFIISSRSEFGMGVSVGTEGMVFDPILGLVIQLLEC